MAADYDTVHASFAGSPIVVAQVDADAHRELGTKFGVSGFPTIKYFPANTLEPEDYTGARGVEDFMTFINGKIGTNKKVAKTPSAVIDLDDSNFDAIVGDAKKHKLVEFYAPWW